MNDESPEYFLIRHWLSRGVTKAFRFDNGLGMAYKPADLPGEQHSLAASRQTGYPSTVEQARVDAALTKVLKERGIVFDPEWPLRMKRELQNGGAVGVCRWTWVVWVLEL